MFHNIPYANPWAVLSTNRSGLVWRATSVPIRLGAWPTGMTADRIRISLCLGHGLLCRGYYFAPLTQAAIAFQSGSSVVVNWRPPER